MNTEKYFEKIQEEVDLLYEIAGEARKKGYDPSKKVEIKLATTLAAKAVGLIASIYPQLEGTEIVDRILELEKKYGQLSPEVSFKIAEEVAEGKYCKFETKLEGIDCGIRIGFSYNTLGVVSSPIEGYTTLKTNKNPDGGEYFVPYFSGPIRSAGTTASCMALILIDYMREKFGYAKYIPTDKEIRRVVTELYDYHEKVTNLQYLPTEEEAEFLATHMPIQVAGEPTEQKEVSNYKDLPRVETDFIRGGFCLIMGEGLAQKAQKGLRILRKLQKSGFVISDWEFLEEYVNLHKKRDEGKKGDSSPTYIKDLVAGRPIFGHPSRSGSFRFRYGRSRAGGFSATSIHPATMGIVAGFLATGTQLKIEKPTKGCAVMVCDTIDGPIIKLKNGSVRKPKTVEESQKLYKDTEEIIYLGDILFSLGDVINRNYQLLKPGYVEEWWMGELQKKKGEELKEIDPRKITFAQAIQISEENDLPLHPEYIYYWTQITYNQFCSLLYWLENSTLAKKLILPWNSVEKEQFSEGKRALELLGVPHDVTTENVVLKEEESKALLYNLGILPDVFETEGYKLKEDIIQLKLKLNPDTPVLDLINRLAFVKIKDKAGTFIGSRMGRPEKAKLRKLIGSPSVLFPVGEEGGRFRSVNEAAEKGEIKGDFPLRYCEKCMRETIYNTCEECNEETIQKYYCMDCRDIINTPKCKEENHNRVQSHVNKRIDSKHYLKKAAEKLGIGLRQIPPLIKGVRGTSNKDHTLEDLSKGILRSKYNLHVNKDGTIRYDATELPITHFKPKEVGTSVEKLIELGYTLDTYGEPLTQENQILEIKPHDIILPACPETKDEKAGEVFLNITQFIDELLEKLYKQKPYYNLKKKEDLVGQLVACMSPHNCAGVVGRIVGFSRTQGLLSSPYIHAAMRRDCFDFDSYIPIKTNNSWKIIKLGEYVEGLNPTRVVDRFGTKEKEAGDVKTIGFDKGVGEVTVNNFTKHTKTGMLEIKTALGRRIKVTQGHKFLIGNKKVKAADLSIGTKLPLPYKINIESRDIPQINLLDYLDMKGLMVRGIRKILMEEGTEKIVRLASEKGIKKRMFDNYHRRDSYPANFILSLNKGIINKILQIGRVGYARDNISLPIITKLSNELLEVVGLFIAEGYARSKGGARGLNQVYIASNDKSIREFVTRVMRKEFGLKPSEKKTDRVTFSSKILYLLFTKILGCGHSAYEKRVPSMFLNFPLERLACVLRGYFEGDGSAEQRRKKVSCDSVSEGLLEDLIFCLARFEIFAKRYDYEKLPGEILKKFYRRKGREIPKFKISKLIIGSDFVDKFKKIGFLSERKKGILQNYKKINAYGMRIEYDKNFVYDPIVSIEDLGEKESYCLNVKTKSHTVFVNSILSCQCDGDEAAVMLLLDVLLNFSRTFLPAHRGGTQDAPLVLNSRLRAGEVDDQILDFEMGFTTPLEVYEMAEEEKHSSELNIKTVDDALKAGEDPFINMGFTHDTDNINGGLVNSSYKFLPTMKDKVAMQMELDEKIRAVDQSDVARLIIERHFIRDIRGNLRKFSQQGFRCVHCNEKYRRPPLTGKCKGCQTGKIIFTVSHGSIIKYLEPALDLAIKYNVSKYLQQSLFLAKSYIESIFGREKEKQAALGQWF